MYPSSAFTVKYSPVLVVSGSKSPEEENFSRQPEERSGGHGFVFQPSFTHYQVPRSFILSPTSMPRRSTSPATAITLFPTNGRNGLSSSWLQELSDSFNFDLLTHLPPEISVKVLMYLHPQDICNASLVCSRWHQLTRYKKLNKRRKVYVQEQRKEYREYKENYTPANYNQVPRHMTKAPSPLSIIQPTNPTNDRVVTSPQSHTPSPTFLVDGVNKLSLEDQQDGTIRRCLFPDLILSPDGSGKKKQLAFSTRHTMIKEVAGKKMNKNRLRRL